MKTKLGKAIDDLRSTQGWKVRQKIELLDGSFYIFRNNRIELFQLLRISGDPRAFLEISKVSNREILDVYFKEVNRRLHNFVASAKMLVDHTRIIARELYEETTFWNEYDLQIETRFKSNQVVQFVHDLRNYTLHYKLPTPRARIRFTQGEDFDTSLRLDMNALQRWNGWSSTARRFFREMGDDEELFKIVNSYTEAVTGFHDWFYNKQIELHQKDFKETDDLLAELGLIDESDE